MRRPIKTIKCACRQCRARRHRHVECVVPPVPDAMCAETPQIPRPKDWSATAEAMRKLLVATLWQVGPIA